MVIDLSVSGGMIWAGVFAGVSKFTGKTDRPLCYVHFETNDGKFVLLADKRLWDAYYKDLKIGDSVIFEMSAVKRDDETIYVFERILMVM